MASELSEDSDGELFSTPTESTSAICVMYQSLTELCSNNATYFQHDDSENGQRLHGGFLALIDHINIASSLVEEVRKVAPQYDFDAKTPANGYRSFVAVVDLFVLHCLKLNRQVIDNRDSFLFRKSHFMREVEACSQLMASLATCMEHLKTLVSWSHDGDLFPNENHSSEELLKLGETINMYCFYGRCLGFQFCESMQNVLKTISISMATFSEIYYSSGGMLSRATNSVWSGSKYIWDPELRARRIVNISQFASVDFCKAFWLLAESDIMTRLPSMVCPTLAVNKVISIPPEPLEHINLNGERIQIPVPMSHVGAAPILVRLLSAVRREEMISDVMEGGTGVQPLSNNLIVHCHGGGFVANSSQSHEIYLRDWAQQLNCPILSVDYSLAPLAPFPRALEEVLYAYCWALKNSHILGTTAENVILAGDSAGGNLVLGLALKCVELNLRPASAMFLVYVPVLVSFVPSPSRLLCLMDPLLPFGFMLRCLKAYACPRDEAAKVEAAKDEAGEGKAGEGKAGEGKAGEGKAGEGKAAKDEAGEGEATTDSESVSSDSKPRIKSLELLKAGSDTESFEEVSESDLLELAAHKSPLSENSDTLKSTFSLTSMQSKTEVDQYLRRSSGENRKLEGVVGGVRTEVHSDTYVSEFLEKYVLDTETDATGKKVPVLRMEAESEEHVLFELPQDLGLHNKFEKAMGTFTSGITTTFNLMTSSVRRSSDASPKPLGLESPKSTDWSPLQPTSPSGISQLDMLMHRSPSDEFKFTVPRDPYLSPYWATDEALAQLPPVSVVTTQFDPCLDDCVMFARKLKRLGNNTSLDVFDGLPHGFLNFATVSKECHSASNVCVERIKSLLHLNPQTDAGIN